MTRVRGWFARGKALLAKVPHGHWKTMTFIGALRQGEIVAPCVFDGAINAARFVDRRPRQTPPSVERVTMKCKAKSAHSRGHDRRR